MAVDLSTVDTLQAAQTCHRERHVAAPATPGVATSFDGGGALQGAAGNAASLERKRSKIDADRACRATATERISRRLGVRHAAGDGI